MGSAIKHKMSGIDFVLRHIRTPLHFGPIIKIFYIEIRIHDSLAFVGNGYLGVSVTSMSPLSRWAEMSQIKNITNR